jgi:predicted phage baseplate assembly protein
MNSPLDQTSELNDCGCCEGVAAETPVQVSNRPGLSAIAYRAGTQTQFRETLQSRLAGSNQPALAGLTTRDADDFSIALLDAWATVGDVLTFYQERIANEAYLRTATERLSVLELARLINYQLRPGVAASAYLAFTLEEAAGALGQALAIGTTAPIAPAPMPPITIDVGTKVQSIPGPGEQAQTFETVERIVARPEWNAIKPRLTEKHPIRRDAENLLFAGLATGLKAGDGLLLFPDDGGEPLLRQVAAVTLESKQERTNVQLQPLIAAPPATAAGAVAVATASTVRNPGVVASRFLNLTINSADLRAFAQIERFEVRDVFANLTAVQPPAPSVFALRTRAAIFGHNAPKWSSLPVILRIGEYSAKPGAPESAFPPLVFTAGPYSTRRTSWAEESLANYPDPDGQEPANTRNIYLDLVYPSIVTNSWVVLKDGLSAKAYQVQNASEVSKSDFTLSAKVSRLTLNTRQGFEQFSIRRTTVFGQSEQLALARLPITAAVSGSQIDLNGWVDGLFGGQTIMVCGELSNTLGVRDCEAVTIDNVEQILAIEGYTRITLRKDLRNSYVRDTVTINGNVALATHGETVQETLGGGDATQPFQRFALRQPPLTYISSADSSGGQSTLELRVNDILWREVPDFFGHSSDERVYVTRLDDDGKTTVIFGDGITGARLPTGQENVKARYRKGIGLPGLVKADQLTQLMTRPLGVKGVTNPIAAAGAADREKLDEARRNAPLTVLTLGRIVSLRDYEDFARTFSGVDKALATWTWFGEKRGVFLTVAGSQGAEVTEGSQLYKHLLMAIQGAGDSQVPVLVKSYQPRLFRLAAALKINPDFLQEKVLAEGERKLRDTFSFTARAFGQPVHLSEVLAAIQNVRGVVAVNVSRLYRSDETSARNEHIAAAVPRPGDDEVFPAELLTLDPRPLELGIFQ